VPKGCESKVSGCRCRGAAERHAGEARFKAEVGGNQARTIRFSRRGRHDGFSWYAVFPAGPAAELWRSAASA
jgi:hypothetical protein